MVEVFNVNKLHDDKHFPEFAKPAELDFFSMDANRQVSRTCQQLKRYVAPPQNVDFEFDLNRGFDTFINKNENDTSELLDCLLRWILLFCCEKVTKPQNGIFSLKDALHNVEFVSWRGLLTKIAVTPYERRDGWIICVTKYKDVYFLCEFETQQKKALNAKLRPIDKRMCYWGFSFEHYVTAPYESSANVLNESSTSSDQSNFVVNNNEQFCSVVRTKLGNHRLLFGGEVDCVDVSDGQYVELKTNRHLETDKQRFNFHKFKLLKWWIQSFLIGINRIVCGFRDDAGYVRLLQTFSVREMPNLARDHWSGAACFNFLHDFLSTIKQTVKDNDPSIVYKFEYDPQRQKVVLDSHVDPNQFGFLRDWFVKGIETQ